jgi:hypothetical protein
MSSGCGRIEGTFCRVGETSESLDAFTPASPHYGHTYLQTGFYLSLRGLDANNAVRLQKSTKNGTENLVAATTSWSTVTDYTSDQSNVQITESAERVVGTNEYAIYRLLCINKGALATNGKVIKYKMSRERPSNNLNAMENGRPASQDAAPAGYTYPTYSYPRD